MYALRSIGLLKSDYFRIEILNMIVPHKQTAKLKSDYFRIEIESSKETWRKDQYAKIRLF